MSSNVQPWSSLPQKESSANSFCCEFDILLKLSLSTISVVTYMSAKYVAIPINLNVSRRGVNVILLKSLATGFYEGYILVSKGAALHCEVLDRTHNERWLQRSAPVDSWKPGRWHDPAVLRKEDFLRNVRLL